MTLKRYQAIKLGMVVAIAIIVSRSVVFENYLIPIATVVAASLILLYLRRSVAEVVADERDHLVGGKAALLTIQIYAWAAVIAMLILYASRDLNPTYEPLAMLLAFSTCILMLLYSLIFRYYERMKFSDKKLLYIFFMLIVFAALAVVSARLLSGEDDWICQNGAWVKHGQPSFPAPTVPCE